MQCTSCLVSAVHVDMAADGCVADHMWHVSLTAFNVRELITAKQATIHEIAIMPQRVRDPVRNVLILI